MKTWFNKKWGRELAFLVKNGFIHIFSANLINRIIQFGISVVIARIISKESFGQFSYALNILNFFLLLDGLGISSGLLQFGSKAKENNEALSFLKFSLLVGASFNILLALSIFAFTIFFDLPIAGSRRFLQMLSFIPFVTVIFNVFQSFTRARLMNKQFSILTVFNTMMLFVFTTVCGLLFDVTGLVVARYTAFVLSIFLALGLLRYQLTGFKNVDIPEKNIQRNFLTFSIVSMLTNSISQTLYLIDTFLIGLMIRSETIVATYKVSTLIPFSLFFIPASIMTFAYPYFAKYSDDKMFVKHYYRKLTWGLFALNSVISLLLIAFAPFVIRLVFGSNYLDAVIPFRILSFGYLIAGTFRIPSGNLIASLGKVKVNFYNAVISGIANVILDILLIKYYGAVGAAIATALIFVISSVVSGWYLNKYLSN
ncbi:MAG: oligosaccharide flippase family protein [Fervidobacterium gondwanense]